MSSHRGWGVLAAVACAALLAVTGPVRAAGLDLLAGVSTTSSSRTTATAFASVYGTRPVGTRVQWAPIATLGWFDARHTRSDDLDHAVALAAGGVRIELPREPWFVSEQVAVTSQRTDALSSRFEFMTSVGWQRGHYIVLLRHVSNGRLIGGGKNLGETMLLMGVVL